MQGFPILKSTVVMQNNHLNLAATWSKINMASRHMYRVDKVIESVLKDNFGLFNEEISDEEGEDIYASLGGPVLSRPELEILPNDLKSDDDDDVDPELDEDDKNGGTGTGKNDSEGSGRLVEMPSEDESGEESQPNPSPSPRVNKHGHPSFQLDCVQEKWKKREPERLQWGCKKKLDLQVLLVAKLHSSFIPVSSLLQYGNDH